MPEIATGSLLESERRYIAHQCNRYSRRRAGLAAAVFKASLWADVYSDRRQPGALHKNLLNQESSCPTEIPAQKVGTMQPLSAFAISRLILHYSVMTRRPMQRRVYAQEISDEQTKSIKQSGTDDGVRHCHSYAHVERSGSFIRS